MYGGSIWVSPFGAPPQQFFGVAGSSGSSINKRNAHAAILDLPENTERDYTAQAEGKRARVASNYSDLVSSGGSGGGAFFHASIAMESDMMDADSSNGGMRLGGGCILSSSSSSSSTRSSGSGSRKTGGSSSMHSEESNLSPSSRSSSAKQSKISDFYRQTSGRSFLSSCQAMTPSLFTQVRTADVTPADAMPCTSPALACPHCLEHIASRGIDGIKCNFCEKHFCSSMRCTAQCDVCSGMFCRTCSRSSYSAQFDRTICLDCCREYDLLD